MRSIDATLHRAALIVIAASLPGPGWVFADAAVRHSEPWTGAATGAAGHRWFMAVPPLLGLPLLCGFVLFVAGARRLDEQRGGRVDPVPVLLLTAIYGALVDLTGVQTPIGRAFCAAWNLLVVLLMVLVARNFRSAPGEVPTASPGTTLGAGPGLGGHP
jgi:hypothetical protein